MKTLKSFFFHAWRPGILILVVGLAAYFVFFYKLGSLLPGYSLNESYTYHSATHFKDVVAHPLNAPYKIPLYIGEKLAGHTLIAGRIIAASIAVIMTLLFFMIVKRWFTYRVALLSTILFATSTALLHVSRLSSPVILEMATLGLISIGFWYNTSKRRMLVMILGVVMCATLLYIPGIFWFELFGFIFWRKKLLGEYLKLSWQYQTLGYLGTILLLAPLIRAFIIFPSEMLLWLGLPEHLPAIHTVASNLVHNILSIGIRSYGSPELWLGHTPILDVIQVVLLIGGVYVFFFRHINLARNAFLLVGMSVTIILSSLGGPIGIAMLVPFLYLIISGGIYVLLHEWLAVFPRNPIARLTGIAVVCVLVSFSVLYQWRSYFIAWPHNKATRSSFNLRS